MTYGESQNHSIVENEEVSNEKLIMVDLRSDTVTKPCRAMRKAMFEAEVGDDNVKEDPTTNRLERLAAELLGKESALFITSGTMGNLVSILVHGNTRGSEIYVGEESHIVQLEQGGAAQIAGVTVSSVPNNPDGTFDLKKLEKKIRGNDNIHFPVSKMIAVENTINGKALPISWLKEVVEFGKKHNLKLHMDGARLFNASVAIGLPVHELVEGFDSVTFCLSKGLGAPVGSILCGSKEFINEARRMRKVLGGGMRQCGILAAAGFVALENRFKLYEDHKRAAAVMETVNNTRSTFFRAMTEGLVSNMTFIQVRETSDVDAKTFAERLGKVVDDHDDDQVIVLAWTIVPGTVRLVFHLNITDELFEAAQRKIKYVIMKLDPVFKDEIPFSTQNGQTELVSTMTAHHNV